MSRSRNLTHEQKVAMVAAFKRGDKALWISQRLGIGVATVYAYKQEWEAGRMVEFESAAFAQRQRAPVVPNETAQAAEDAPTGPDALDKAAATPAEPPSSTKEASAVTKKAPSGTKDVPRETNEASSETPSAPVAPKEQGDFSWKNATVDPAPRGRGALDKVAEPPVDAPEAPKWEPDVLTPVPEDERPPKAPEAPAEAPSPAWDRLGDAIRRNIQDQRNHDRQVENAVIRAVTWELDLLTRHWRKHHTDLPHEIAHELEMLRERIEGLSEAEEVTATA